MTPCLTLFFGPALSANHAGTGEGEAAIAGAYLIALRMEREE